MKYLITISYDGSKYHGLQKLKDKKTIQGELEKTLTKCNQKFVKVTASGRTDKGVHALKQICTFNLDKEITPFKLKGYLNRSTSPYLRIHDCIEIDDKDFHPRFCVKSKTYKYIINTGEYDPIKEDYQYNFCKSLNIDNMTQAAELFIGPHNYHAFVTGKHQTYNSIIDEITIKEIDNLVIIKIKGAAFYTYMVRNIVKILILIGTGKITETDILNMLKTGKKSIEYSPVPPGGLYLEDVEY